MYAYTAAEVHVSWLEGATALLNWDGACMAEWYTTALNQEDFLQVPAHAASGVLLLELCLRHLLALRESLLTSR